VGIKDTINGRFGVASKMNFSICHLKVLAKLYHDIHDSIDAR
jgi:hypothetical protein